MFSKKAIGELIKQNLTLSDDLKRLSEGQKDLLHEVRELDRRLSRVEGRVDTIMDVAAISSKRALPKSD
ncbi:MAG: hypothetical protein CSA81_10585 [Acidobacteria bacterium]|nr:MAG: hypothetical protein CSA81_10585 [Acidobacteriota bacterium]PIE89925.1 MAG: hypothetical protein CR997_08920 [Acidobacteriota bacterium]